MRTVAILCLALMCHAVTNAATLNLKEYSGEDRSIQRQKRDINECDSAPCLNGAVCVDGVNAYNCTCALGYLGPTCAIDTCATASSVNALGGWMQYPTSGNYLNNIYCLWTIDTPNATQYIVLTLRWIDINNSSNSSCSNDNDYLSIWGRYTERFCYSSQTAATHTFYFNQLHLYFQSDNSITGTGFYLNYTFHNLSDINECDSIPCLNGGACSDHLNNYTCTCAAGYTGGNCATNINECSSNPCLNGKVCTDGINNYTCACTPGYAGVNCATNINECNSNPCLNGGTCVDGVNKFTCTCADGFGGMTCKCKCAPGHNGLNCDNKIDP